MSAEFIVRTESLVLFSLKICLCSVALFQTVDRGPLSVPDSFFTAPQNIRRNGLLFL
jgi:hypothetical protein